jgi:Rha family phage regulatory protein
MNAQLSIKDLAQQVHCDVVDKNATVTSLQVAEHFDKRHDNVLRDIAQLAEEVAQLDGTYTGVVFIDETYSDERGRSQRLFRLNRDAFALLAMGFTGQKALRWKLAYIEAFNQLEALQERERQLPRTVAGVGPSVFAIFCYFAYRTDLNEDEKAMIRALTYRLSTVPYKPEVLGNEHGNGTHFRLIEIENRGPEDRARIRNQLACYRSTRVALYVTNLNLLKIEEIDLGQPGYPLHTLNLNRHTDGAIDLSQPEYPSASAAPSRGQPLRFVRMPNRSSLF